MDYTSIMVISVLVIIAIVSLIIAIKKNGLRPVAIKLILKAEDLFDYGMNSEKFNYVFDNIYNSLPVLFKILISKAEIVEFIQNIFDEIKEALDYQK